MLALERRLPALDGLDAVGGPPDIEIRHRPHRRQVLYRLMGRAVLPKADRIVGENMRDPDFHQRRDPERRTAIVGEAEERRPGWEEAAVHGDAIARRRH